MEDLQYDTLASGFSNNLRWGLLVFAIAVVWPFVMFVALLLSSAVDFGFASRSTDDAGWMALAIIGPAMLPVSYGLMLGFGKRSLALKILGAVFVCLPLVSIGMGMAIDLGLISRGSVWDDTSFLTLGMVAWPLCIFFMAGVVVNLVSNMRRRAWARRGLGFAGAALICLLMAFILAVSGFGILAIVCLFLSAAMILACGVAEAIPVFRWQRHQERETRASWVRPDPEAGKIGRLKADV